MKTGFTKMAGRTLVSSAKKDGQTLIVVTLSDPDDWKDHTALFEYGFKTYPAVSFYEKGERVSNLPVEGSLIRSVPVYAMETLAYPLTEEEQKKAEVTKSLPKDVAAPVQKGTIAGTLQLKVKGKVVQETYLVYGEDVPRHAVASNEGIRRTIALFRSGDSIIETILTERIEQKQEAVTTTSYI